jgi:hypothetical protein
MSIDHKLQVKEKMKRIYGQNFKGISEKDSLK